jgi:precorrin-2 dehydrogenase/sirohydrochlorin ferrochelatase
VNLGVANRDCLVVGGGDVGERKVRALLDCGADVSVISKQATHDLKALASKGLVVLKLRSYEPSDLDGRFLVIGATDEEETNQRISHDAAQRGILCNIADRPEACTFVLPAVVRQGDLVIAVSTSNKSPAVAKRIRQRLEKEFGPEYATLLKLMGAIRQRLFSEAKSPEANKNKLERLLDLGLLEMIRENRTEDLDAMLTDMLGEHYTWNGLMKS